MAKLQLWAIFQNNFFGLCITYIDDPLSKFQTDNYAGDDVVF